MADNDCVLKNKSKISIVGGGPAGAFLAIHLQKEAQKVGKQLDITIIEKMYLAGAETDGASCCLPGCNYCAGVISPGLYRALADYGLTLPRSIVHEEFSHVWLQGHWKNFPLKVPAGQKLCAVFRGSLPSDRGKFSPGLDAFLLEQAVQNGARVISGSVLDFELSQNPPLTLTIKSTAEGVVKPAKGIVKIDSELIAICCGVNALFLKDKSESPLLRAMKRIDPAFRPPGVRPALIFEMKPGEAYIRKYLNKELYLIVSGSKDLRLEHIALVPKKTYISVALVGNSIDNAVFPKDTAEIIDAFLALPHIRAILPGITSENVNISCLCSPMMAVTPSRPIIAPRIVLAGDILGAKLYRDGLHSAFISAKMMAETIVHKGVDRQNLRQATHAINRWIAGENRYCKHIFNAMQATLKLSLPSRILYQSFATEMKFKKTGAWPLGNILWNVAGGAAEYETIFKNLLTPPVLASLAVGTYKTIRNMITELFFGLKWGDYGRYPTVIIKDKRQAFKNAIQKPLGITLDRAPQMERMYAVKIRAPSKAIFEELAKFGERRAEFLRLRFVDVKRTRGRPNEVGAVVTYRLKILPIAMDLHLVKTVPGKTLLYTPQELFTTRGILLFDVSPTIDGNHRLVVYTAFDYKRGQSPTGRIFFTLLKYFFPDFAHDVVWNHALCTIKANAEKATLIDEKEVLIG